ncbi:MAG TPA: winged helix-turn-helix domain-containing protein [Pyrinomonadaceae bacterium]|jgi:DNA-binding winged helix-turn-helix (wHTH) protein
MSVPRNDQRKSKRNPKSPSEAIRPATTNRVYYFGSFCLNQAEQQLLHKGEPVRLAPKAFEVLRVLIENKGCLVVKERLLREVWPDVFVEEANLSVNIASLRKALAEGDVEQQCIETVPKRGYRFVAQVSELTYRGGETLNETVKFLAVLPFENEGCGPAGEYLSSGLMESITNSLSQSSALRVMARHTVSSCHSCNIDARAVGHKLGVRSVLVGRILQLGDRLIVRAELVDVMNGWQLWGEQYHTRISDILLTQQELTALISAAVLSIT